MRRVFLVAQREYKAIVKTKGFIIGLAIAPLIMSASILFAILAEKRVDTTDKTVAIVDLSGQIAPAILEAAQKRNETELIDQKSGKKVLPAYFFEIIDPNPDAMQEQRLELSNRIRAGQLHAFLEIGKDVIHPGSDPETGGIRYYAKNAAMDDLRKWLAWPMNTELRKIRMADAGIDAASVPHLFNWINAEGMGLVSVDSKTGTVGKAQRSDEFRAIMIPMAALMAMYMLVMMGAMPLMNSVVEEKNQKIAEMLLASIRPVEFMAGKMIGGIGITLTSAAVYFGAGLAVVGKFNWLALVPPEIIPWFIVYLVCAVLMEGAVFSAIGSACNDARDAQNWTLPAILPVLLPLLMMVPILKEPNGFFATTMSLIPPFTPMLMLARQSAPGGIPAWQPWIGLLEVIGFTSLCIYVGGRIFRVGILMQGKPPRLKDLIRWAIKG